MCEPQSLEDLKLYNVQWHLMGYEKVLDHSTLDRQPARGRFKEIIAQPGENKLQVTYS